MDSKNMASKQDEQAPVSSKKTCPHNNKKAIVPILALIALVVAGFSSLQIRSLRLQGQAQKAQYERVVLALKAEQTQHMTTIDQTLQTWHDSEQKLQTRLDGLGKNLQTALQQRMYQKQDWLLLKARHYLELAQINAHWTDDPAASIAMLQEADMILRESPDQRLFPVRQSIASEISQLQALPTVDIAGPLSQLDAARTSVSSLPIKALAITPADSTPGSTPDSWRSKLHNSLSVLEQLVVIKHQDDETLKPMLSPLYQALLRESIRMNLQMAQWAIVQNDPPVYQQALNQALQDINRIFDDKAIATQSLVKSLQGLQQKTFNAKKPAIHQSLTLLNQLIETAAGDKTP